MQVDKEESLLLVFTKTLILIEKLIEKIKNLIKNLIKE